NSRETSNQVDLVLGRKRPEIPRTEDDEVPDQVSKVMTIDGPVPASSLGVTLTHEHIFSDIGCYVTPPRTDVQKHMHSHQDLTIEMLGEIRRDVTVFTHLLRVDDADLVIEELADYKAAGGQTLVEVSTTMKPQRVAMLPDVARSTGVTIVRGCGYYIQESHPPEVAEHDVDWLTDKLISVITQGFGNTGIRPGVIGEIGMSQPVYPDEWKVLAAACKAQKKTGLSLMIHPFFGARSRIAPEVATFVLRQGVDPGKVCMSHMDGNMDVEYQARVAELGVYIAFDTFGVETYYDSLEYNHDCHDSEREELLIQLIDKGYLRQLLISQDCGLRIYLRRYGGYGYSHILRHIVPSLKHRGLDDETLRRLLVSNAADFLASPPVV
ncbi:MAG TPA: hypothetical protein VGV87_18740, partial [Blastocatellia bacterium]|nr:hypothetical protein [Blastocatellia bacterium]